MSQKKPNGCIFEDGSMKKRWVGSLAALVFSGGFAAAQMPETNPARAAGEATTFQGAPYAVSDDHSPLRGLFGMGSETCQPRVWGDFDYLLWKFKQAQVPVPLVTTSTTPADGVFPADLGAIGNPSTRLLYGNTDLSSPTWESGFRLTLGGWLDSERHIGIEGSGFIFSNTSPTDFSTTQNDPTKILAIPFVNTAPAGSFNNINPVNVGAQTGNNAFLLAGGSVGSPFGPPNVGSVSITSTTSFWGAEINGLINLYRDNRTQINFLAGFRYLDLQEDLYINATTGVNLPFIGPNETSRFSDQFGTRNQFYGGQLGLRAEWTNGTFFASAMGKVALGVNHEEVTVNGSYVDLLPTFYTGFGAGPGGLFAQRTNIGTTYRNQFAVTPEAELRVGINLLTNLRIFAGYDFLYLSNVVRPGNQIDPHINVTGMGSSPINPGFPGPLVGAAQPASQFNQTNFWAQGITFGIQISY